MHAAPQEDDRHQYYHGQPLRARRHPRTGREAEAVPLSDARPQYYKHTAQEVHHRRENGDEDARHHDVLCLEVRDELLLQHLVFGGRGSGTVVDNASGIR